MTAPLPELAWTDLGRMAYAAAWRLQRDLVAERKAGLGEDRLLLVEHPPVLTLGRRADPRHILADEAALRRAGIGVFEVERGGDVTYHGPGQLVAYPILDLRGYRCDLRWFSGALCEVVVRCLADFGLAAEARSGAETGVWVALPGGQGAKIAALGLRVERWISYHGIALNVDPDLAAFDLIVPCGLRGSRVSSMAALLGRAPEPERLRSAFLAAFGAVFGRRLLRSPLAMPGAADGAERSP